MMKKTETGHSQYWKSLDEKYRTPEFVEHLEKEFQSSPFREKKQGLARRQFMKLMGASIALSSTACVRRPVQKIIPYNKRPKEVVIGLPNYYASSFFDGRELFAITVKTREGRPLFVQANPSHSPLSPKTLSNDKSNPENPTETSDHPFPYGLSPRGTSQILSLYDPDRIRTPIINSQDPKKRGNSLSIPRDWESLDKRLIKAIKKSLDSSQQAKTNQKTDGQEDKKQGGVHILTAPIHSPTLRKLLKDFAKKTRAKVHFWSPVNFSEKLSAEKLCYGTRSRPQYHYDKARLIVSIDADFLGTFDRPMRATGLFSKNRNPEKPMSRLVSFQTVTSLTSMNADDNHSIKASQQLPLVLAIIHELALVQKKVSIEDQLIPLVQSFAHKPDGANPSSIGFGRLQGSVSMEQKDFKKLVEELWKHRGQSLVLAGGLQTKTKDALSLQIAVNYLNELLGNEGKTITHPLLEDQAHDSDLSDLMTAMEAGQVGTLIINELNPVYNLPSSQNFVKYLSQVDNILVTNNWMDETAIMADLVAPSGHPMENWGDNEFEPGLTAIQQPTIRPLHNTRSFADSLMAWSKSLGTPITREENFYSLLKSQWTKKLKGEKAWMDFLQRGFWSDQSKRQSQRQSFKTSALKKIQVTLESSPLELSLYEKVATHDGTMTNVSWIQELPDPVSKIVWDNYLMISPSLAQKKKLKEGHLVEVKTAHHKMELPVYISPGLHPGSVAVAIGYGHKMGGELEKGVGFGVSDFIQGGGLPQEHLVHAGFPVEIKKTGKFHPLAQTQGHHNMEGRQLALETSEKHYKETGSIGLHKHKVFSIWKDHKYEGHKWGMAIDLNSCTGCSSCMLACQSENNIPVVGKENVLSGREMHWIRIDRYYSGNENKSVDSLFQPVTCQHCENAPCETVCPVLATVHSDEGLNDMVYNRCVGTRYCSNNCPYKVRRFNWFYYDSHHKKDPLQMALNPDVTVRSRGVMEKCTFCIQRIKSAKNTAKEEGRELKDGEIQTACQSVCPTKAIVFGDLNDKNSQVSQLFKDQRHYSLLEEFNTAPRVRYLAKIRNTDRPMGHDENHDSHGQNEHSREGHKTKGKSKKET